MTSVDTSTDRAPDSQLDVAVEVGDGWTRRLTITVPPERVGRARATERKRLSQRVRIKGFRRGRIPPDLIEQRYGQFLDEHVRSSLVEEAYREAVDESELRPAGAAQITNVQYAPGERLTFQAEFEIMPAVRLDRVGGFRIEREIEPVTDEEVTKILDGIRNEHGDWTPVERKPVEGERVTVVIEPLASPEDQPTGEASPYQFVLGSGEALEDVERAIRELTSGGSGVFEVSFGTDEEADAEADTRHLHIRLDQVEERLLPDLDDDLATKVGDFENLAALESAVREDLAKHHAEESEATVRGQLMQAVIEANPFALPAALVDRYLDELIQAPDDADPGKVREARSELVPLAERQIKEQMILDHLIEREGLKASTEEVEAEIGRLAERRNIQPQEVRRRLVREGALHTVERNLAADKVFEYLKGESGVA